MSGEALTHRILLRSGPEQEERLDSAELHLRLQVKPSSLTQHLKLRTFIVKP